MGLVRPANLGFVFAVEVGEGSENTAVKGLPSDSGSWEEFVGTLLIVSMSRI